MRMPYEFWRHSSIFAQIFQINLCEWFVVNLWRQNLRRQNLHHIRIRRKYEMGWSLQDYNIFIKSSISSSTYAAFASIKCDSIVGNGCCVIKRTADHLAWSAIWQHDVPHATSKTKIGWSSSAKHRKKTQMLMYFCATMYECMRKLGLNTFLYNWSVLVRLLPRQIPAKSWHAGLKPPILLQLFYRSHRTLLGQG